MQHPVFLSNEDHRFACTAPRSPTRREKNTLGVLSNHQSAGSSIHPNPFPDTVTWGQPPFQPIHPEHSLSALGVPLIQSQISQTNVPTVPTATCALTGELMWHPMYSLRQRCWFEYGMIVPAMPEMRTMKREQLVDDVRHQRPLGSLQLVYDLAVGKASLQHRLFNSVSWAQIEQQHQAYLSKLCIHHTTPGHLTLGQKYLLRQTTVAVVCRTVFLLGAFVVAHQCSRWLLRCQPFAVVRPSEGIESWTLGRHRVGMDCQGAPKPSTFHVHVWYLSGIIVEHWLTFVFVGLSYLFCLRRSMLQADHGISEVEADEFQHQWQQHAMEISSEKNASS